MSALDKLKKKRVLDRTSLENALLFSRHGEVEKAAEELAAKDKAIESAIVALRLVIHDRPTVHTDEVWEQILSALSELENLK